MNRTRAALWLSVLALPAASARADSGPGATFKPAGMPPVAARPPHLVLTPATRATCNRAPDPDFLIAAPSGPAPSETWGNLVVREPDGSPMNFQSRYPWVTIYFRLIVPYPGTNNCPLRTVDATYAGLLPPVGRVGVRYGFYLQQRPRQGTDEGLLKDPARLGAIYDPTVMQYIGYTVLVHGDYWDPNRGVQVQWSGVGRPHAPFEDLVGFTR